MLINRILREFMFQLYHFGGGEGWGGGGVGVGLVFEG